MILIVAEKPSVARDIARVLHPSPIPKDGYLECGNLAVTWCIGHLVGIAAPEAINPGWKSWNAASLPLVPPGLKFPLAPRNEDTAKQLRTIEGLMKSAKEIVNACDAGREGELIWRHVVQYLNCERTKATRMWLQSMTPAAIKAAWQERLPVTNARYANLAVSAQTREQADWMLGLNMTRAVTLALPRPEVKSGAAVWSVGRVQTPVLALIARRDLAIAQFKPLPFWKVNVDLEGSSGLFTAALDVPTTVMRFDEFVDRFLTEADAYEAAQQASSGSWTCIDTGTPGRELPPLPFSLSELQQFMARVHGWQAQRTLNVAQECYEKFKVLTYPRTESSCLPNDYLPTAERVFELVCAHLSLTSITPAKSLQGKRIFDSSKVSDHFAIIPTEIAPPNDMRGDALELWTIVAGRFVLSFAPSAEFIKTTRLLTRVDGLTGRASGKVYTNEGWLTLQKTLFGKDDEDEAIEVKALVNCDQTAQSIKAVVSAGRTTAPKPYDEATLLAVMEDVTRIMQNDSEEFEARKTAISARGLGTPATRAAIIEILVLRAFIRRTKSGKRPILRSTEAGRSLIAFLVDQGLENITLPEETAEWEIRLQGIESGSGMRREAFLGDLLETLTSGLGGMRKYIETRQKTAESRGTGLYWNDEEIREFPKCYRVLVGKKKQIRINLWKEVGGHQFTVEEYVLILTAMRNKSPLPSFDFVSAKTNTSFRAAVELEQDGKVRYVFDAPQHTST
jgi:DNA topoisomerase-3